VACDRLQHRPDDYLGWFKLTNTPVVATDDNSCFFRYQSSVNSGKWQLNCSRAGVDVTSNLDLGSCGIHALPPGDRG